MRIRLMHNPTAGLGSLPGEELVAALRSAGHEPIYLDSKDAKALAEMERDPGELIVAAGGDGTIGRVAKRLVGRGVPIVVLPAGTANNLASALGATTGFASQLARLDAARRQPFDVGVISWRGREAQFLESVGGGLIARAIEKLDEDERQGKFKFDSPEEEKRHVMGEIRELLKEARPARWRVEADGQDLSGEYLLVEVMNIPAIGPGLRLAPRAEIADGKLDVVLIGEDRREELDGYMEWLGRGEGGNGADGAEKANFGVSRARRVVVDGPGEPMHVDDDIVDAGVARLGLLGQALTFVVT